MAKVHTGTSFFLLPALTTSGSASSAGKILVKPIMLLCCNFFHKYVDRNETKYSTKLCGIRPGTKSIKNFQRILKQSKVTVYAEEYGLCTLLENMPQSHIL